MTRSRYVWLTPRDLRRDAGPIENLAHAADGASGQLRYAAQRPWWRTMTLLLAACGAGLVIAAPLIAIGGHLWAAALIAIGAIYAVALRLALTIRARDRTLDLHGRFFAAFARIRVAQVHRPDIAAIRLRQAVAARQGNQDARDLCAATLLRAAAPIAAGLWLASDFLPVAILLSGAALALGLLGGALAEQRRDAAAFRVGVAKTAFGKRARHFVAAWPTLRTFKTTDAMVAGVRSKVPLAADARSVRANLRISALFRLAVPALPIALVPIVVNLTPAAILGIAVAVAATGQAGAVMGIQGARIRRGWQQRGVADRILPPEPVMGQAVERIETLEVRDLTFRYRNAAAPVFEDVDLILQKGEVLALASPSGSGKTTLLRVITGLAEPAAGQVRINGSDAAALAYRQHVAAVFQDEPIGAGTIRAAIAGNAPIGLDEVWAAAARVGADALIRELPMAMQTLIVEGPFPPSLLQPLLIARALAQQPDLLVLDEALGALPYDQAERLLQSLRAEGRLVIFASHDPRLVALADKALALGTD